MGVQRVGARATTFAYASAAAGQRSWAARMLASRYRTSASSGASGQAVRGTPVPLRRNAPRGERGGEHDVGRGGVREVPDHLPRRRRSRPRDGPARAGRRRGFPTRRRSSGGGASLRRMRAAASSSLPSDWSATPRLLRVSGWAGSSSRRRPTPRLPARSGPRGGAPSPGGATPRQSTPTHSSLNAPSRARRLFA